MHLCILCGGRSAEHEISLESAYNVVAAVDRKRFDLTIVGISRDGSWNLYDPDAFVACPGDAANIRLDNPECPVLPVRAGQGRARLISLDSAQTVATVDAVFPLLHGTNGEDGTVQGLLTIVDVPFVGCDVTSSANCMDKTLTKRLLRDAGIPVCRSLVLQQPALTPEAAAFVDTVGFPVFVKPARMGSSVGITRVTAPHELDSAVAEAFRYDRKILLEEEVKGREIECAVLGNDKPQASVPGEIIPQRDYYSYESKYLDADGARLEAPAALAPTVEKAVKNLALQSFNALNCEGMARVDMFLMPDKSLVVNEVNTIPGFTGISMYPRLWQLSGIPYPTLIEKLVALAVERYQRDNTLTFQP